MKLRDKFWIWGQGAGTHHSAERFKLVGENKMSPIEGARYLGIPNMCRVVMDGDLQVPIDIDKEGVVLNELKNVIWSIYGSDRTGEVSYYDEIIRMLDKCPNIMGGIFDDFLAKQERLDECPPEKIHEMRANIEKITGKPFEMWLVVYVFELFEKYKPWMDAVDVVTMWTWKATEIKNMRQNYETLRKITGPDKRIVLGNYMWDYGNAQHMRPEDMQYQLDLQYEMLKSKEIDGIIFCSNCTADCGLETSDMVRDFIAKHGDEEI